MRVDNLITSVDFESKISKAGKPFKIWNVTLDNGTVLKMGFNKPSYVVGQRLVGTASTNKFGDLEFSEGGVPAPTATPTGGAPRASAPRQDKTFPVGKLHPDMAIIRQNALTNANATVSTLVGVVDMAEHSVESIIDLVIETAYKYAEFSSGQREAKMVTHMTGGDDE